MFWFSGLEAQASRKDQNFNLPRFLSLSSEFLEKLNARTNNCITNRCSEVRPTTVARRRKHIVKEEKQCKVGLNEHNYANKREPKDKPKVPTKPEKKLLKPKKQ